MKTIVLAVVAAVAALVPAWAQVFYYQPENRAHLLYLDIWNQFDSSAVLYEFGEVSIVHSNGVVQRLGMADSIGAYGKFQGSGEQGVSADLQQRARTGNFVLPAGGVFTWFRDMQVFRTPCDELTDTPVHPNQPGTQLNVPDRTEFVVQLVRAEDDVVLDVLDSAGVLPSDAFSATGSRYGAHSSVRHTHAVPAGYAGVAAYIRISPRRYGPTPLGMTMSPTPYWVNRLALYDSSGHTHIGQAAVQAMRKQYFEQFVAYCDSTKLTTGWLPDYNGVTMSKDESAVFYGRYFARRQDATFGEYYEELPPAGAKASVLQRLEHAGASGRPLPGAIIKEVSPQPVNTGECTIHTYSVQKLDVRFRLLTVEGSPLDVLWSGTLEQGRMQIVLSIPPVANGAYVLMMEQVTGEPISGKKILIARK